MNGLGWLRCFQTLAGKQCLTSEGITSVNYRRFNWRLLDTLTYSQAC